MHSKQNLLTTLGSGNSWLQSATSGPLLRLYEVKMLESLTNSSARLRAIRSRKIVPCKRRRSSQRSNYAFPPHYSHCDSGARDAVVNGIVCRNWYFGFFRAAGASSV